MKRQKIQLIVLIILLIICAGGYFGLKSMNLSEKEEAEKKTQVLMMDKNEIKALSYQGEDGSASFEKSGEEWRLEGDSETRVLQNSVDLLLEDISEIESEDVIVSPKDVSDYGLGTPKIVITATLSDGTEKTVKIGTENEVTGQYYIMVDGDVNVYTISPSFVNDFSKGQEEFIDTSTPTDAESSSEAEE